MYGHDKPVLDLAWHSVSPVSSPLGEPKSRPATIWAVSLMPSQSGTKLFSGGCDGAVKCYDLSNGSTTLLHQHEKPVKCVEYVEVGGQQIVVSAGWDCQLRVSFNGGGIPVLPFASYAHGAVLGSGEQSISR